MLEAAFWGIVTRGLALGTVLDGIPESFVLGASILQEGRRSRRRRRRRVHLQRARSALRKGWAAAGGLDPRPVFRMWNWVVLASVAATVAGWLTLDRMPTAGGAFTAGALLVMLADTLMPEAFDLGRDEAGLATALGFAVGFGLS